MNALIASGLLIDFIIVLMILELAVLAWLSQRRGRGLSLPALACNAVAGIGLLLALRAALTGSLATVPVWLLVGGLGHAADLLQRSRQRGLPR